MAEILPSYIDAEFCMMMTHLVIMPNTHTHTCHGHNRHYTWCPAFLKGGGGGGQDRVRGCHLTAEYNYRWGGGGGGGVRSTHQIINQ